MASEVVAEPPMSTWLVVVPSRTPELLKKLQLISDVPPAPASVPQKKRPVPSLLISQEARLAVRSPPLVIDSPLVVASPPKLPPPVKVDVPAPVAVN